jgi:L-iditol 2-dehydrogenase
MAGIVAQVGSEVKNFKAGDRVVVGNSAPCGECLYCQKGSFSLCEDLLFLNGAYSDFILVPARIVKVNLHKIPDHLDFATAALSEPLACVLHAFEKVAPQRGEQAVLLGAGPMGVLFVQLAKLYGVEIFAVARDKTKLENLKKLGAREIFSLTEDAGALENLRAQLHGGRGADVVIEAVGLPEVWERAVGLARPGGRVCFYGGCARGTEVRLDTYRIHYEELQLFGVFHHTPEYFRKAVQLLSAGKIKTEGLVVGEIGLGDYQKIFRKGMTSHPLKYAVIP